MDFGKISGYEVVRLYGTDCNQISNVIAATHSSVKLFLGIFDINSIQSEVQTISSVWLLSVVLSQVLSLLELQDIQREESVCFILVLVFDMTRKICLVMQSAL